ncbi:MAG: TetR/AcrR family transcriptional regulator [Actinobacteria bacterium]|nr:TetR/AcrR family transcriptional regulator [Actinomycetota bacterium]
MATQDTVDETRNRIIDAARRCFYRHGITATGVDTLAEEAGVSKRTLYNHFGSKDGLITAYLQRRETRWRRRLAARLEDVSDDPIERVLAYVDGYADPPDDQEFRGCAMINAAAELVDDQHPALGVIRGSLDNIERGIETILDEAGVTDAATVAAQVLLVLEGALNVAGIRRSEEPFACAESLIVELVGRHLPER